MCAHKEGEFVGSQANTQAPHWSLALMISGEGLDFEAIARDLALESTDTRVKGEVINRLPLIVSQEDCWLHEIELADNEGTDPKMHALLGALERGAQMLGVLCAKHEVILRLYIRSDYAQIFYRLMPDTMTRLAGIGLPLEVSMVSWGGLTFQTGGDRS